MPISISIRAKAETIYYHDSDKKNSEYGKASGKNSDINGKSSYDLAEHSDEIYKTRDKARNKFNNRI